MTHLINWATRQDPWSGTCSESSGGKNEGSWGLWLTNKLLNWLTKIRALGGSCIEMKIHTLEMIIEGLSRDNLQLDRWLLSVTMFISAVVWYQDGYTDAGDKHRDSLSEIIYKQDVEITLQFTNVYLWFRPGCSGPVLGWTHRRWRRASPAWSPWASPQHSSRLKEEENMK